MEKSINTIKIRPERIAQFIAEARASIVEKVPEGEGQFRNFSAANVDTGKQYDEVYYFSIFVERDERQEGWMILGLGMTSNGCWPSELSLTLAYGRKVYILNCLDKEETLEKMSERMGKLIMSARTLLAEE